MKIYIASSWANVHAVEMLTKLLRDAGHEVASFVEYGTKPDEVNKWGDFDKWVWSENGEDKFVYNVKGIINADMVIYLGPSGIDTWAEIGYAYASSKSVYGITNTLKDKVGLNRRMVVWVDGFETLLDAIGNMT